MRIIEQGEGGSSHDVERAHYGRFLTVLDEYKAMRAADPAFEPAHPVTAATVRTVEGEPPSGPFITDPTTAAVSDLFNVANDLVLQILTRYFVFGQETEAELAVLTDASVALMFGAIKPLGLLLASLPVGAEEPGRTAGANFQLAYKANFLLPHRRVAWIRFAERLDEAADFADGIGGDARTSAALAPASQLLRRTGASLLKHVDLSSDEDEGAAPGGGPAPDAAPPHITVDARGPYRVHGQVPLRRMRDVRSQQDEPESWQVTARLPDRTNVALCRCGQSATKPYCDNTHTRVDWDPTEAAPIDSYDERATLHPGAGIVMRDDRSICAHVGFCTNQMTTVWRTVREMDPTDTVARSYVMAMIERCPSGALAYRLHELEDDIEPQYGLAINVTADGPLFVTGGLPIERSDGQPLEPRNRVVLCRCGASAIKPLCDGSHREAGFRDSGTTELSGVETSG